MSDEAAGGAPEYPDDVQILEVDGRQLILVGTAHISRESVDLVRRVIEHERPDRVCVELDERRFTAMKDEKHWERLDLRQVIRDQQLSTLLVNIVLASFQKRLGAPLGVTPGADFLAAVQVAEELGIPVSLCDRDIRVTLRRTWHSLGFVSRIKLTSVLFASLFDTTELSEEDLRQLRQKDVFSELLEGVGAEVPGLKRVLIDERDRYLASRILQSEGGRVVAVVGAGHVEGMKRTLAAREEVDLAAIEVIPPVSAIWKVVGWGIPAIIVGSIAFIGWQQGIGRASESAVYWFLVTGLLSALGGLLAFAHPLTTLTAFLAAPFTTLSPLIGAGHVCAAVQAYVRPPLVAEFKTLNTDAVSLRGWWRNRLLRIFVVFLMTSFGATIGMWLGSVRIVRDLF